MNATNAVSHLISQRRAIAAALAASAADTNNPGNILLTLDEVLAITRVGRTQWLKGVKEKTYPQPVRLSPRKIFWRAVDIERLLQNPPSERGKHVRGRRR